MIVTWLADDYGLGRGHTMALISTFRENRRGGRDAVALIDKQFAGAQQHWRADRFEASGSWNSMVTHRVRITDPTQIDPAVLDWLRRAYDAA